MGVDSLSVNMYWQSSAAQPELIEYVEELWILRVNCSYMGVF